MAAQVKYLNLFTGKGTVNINTAKRVVKDFGSIRAAWSAVYRGRISRRDFDWFCQWHGITAR